MKAHIHLPDGLLIDYMVLCKEIAKAICPASEQELKNVDCITGKLVTHKVVHPKAKRGDAKWPVIAALQCVLLSDDGRTLDQLDAAASPTPHLPFGGEWDHDVVEVSLPYKLTDQDRQRMEVLLADLPQLHYPMSEDEIAIFMRAYFDSPDRPDWEPILVTAATIEHRQVKQDAIMLQNQNALQDELTHRRVVAVDRNHVPVARFAVGAFLPREQAIAYLGRCGILYSDKGVDCQPAVESKAPAAQSELREEQGPIGKRKLNDKQRKELVVLRNKLELDGVKDFRQQVAKKFGISPRRVQAIVAEEKAKQNESRIDILLTTKKK